MSPVSGAKLCEQCSKEPAAVYVTVKSGDTVRQQALCLWCAEGRKIPSVREFIRAQKKSAAELRMCEQCGEQPATVFISVLKDGGKQKAICAFCARAQGIQPVADLDLSDAELREIHAELLSRMQAQKSESFFEKLRRRIKKLGNAE